jgi:hypothetical protein
MQPNDDGSSVLISIPFTFNLYGQAFNAIYINNNGNITFNGPLFSFTPSTFPSTGNAIVAPFWADVDTRNGNGQVLYKITTAVYINWVEVGYFSMHGDKINTFQLIITNSSDPVIDGGNVAFCYQNMDWTTGDASDGVNGFGGEPATCGANKGDGLAYFLISRFDHPGNDFDGALDNPTSIWTALVAITKPKFRGHFLRSVAFGLALTPPLLSPILLQKTRSSYATTLVCSQLVIPTTLVASHSPNSLSFLRMCMYNY